MRYLRRRADGQRRQITLDTRSTKIHHCTGHYNFQLTLPTAVQVDLFCNTYTSPSLSNPAAPCPTFSSAFGLLSSSPLIALTLVSRSSAQPHFHTATSHSTTPPPSCINCPTPHPDIVSQPDNPSTSSSGTSNLDRINIARFSSFHHQLYLRFSDLRVSHRHPHHSSNSSALALSHIAPPHLGHPPVSEYHHHD